MYPAVVGSVPFFCAWSRPSPVTRIPTTSFRSCPPHSPPAMSLSCSWSNSRQPAAPPHVPTRRLHPSLYLHWLGRGNKTARGARTTLRFFRPSMPIPCLCLFHPDGYVYNVAAGRLVTAQHARATEGTDKAGDQLPGSLRKVNSFLLHYRCWFPFFRDDMSCKAGNRLFTRYPISICRAFQMFELEAWEGLGERGAASAV